MARRRPGVQYFVEHHGADLFIMTNASPAGFRTGADTADTARDAQRDGAASRPAAEEYRATPGDRAEVISFSRWSAADWGAADGSSPASGGPQKGLPGSPYQAGPADRAEDISFSCWSPADWGAQAQASNLSDSSSQGQPQPPATPYQVGPADRADDISFSRWSPTDWEGGGVSANEGGDPGSDAAEYRLLRMPAADGLHAG